MGFSAVSSGGTPSKKNVSHSWFCCVVHAANANAHISHRKLGRTAQCDSVALRFDEGMIRQYRNRSGLSVQGSVLHVAASCPYSTAP